MRENRSLLSWPIEGIRIIRITTSYTKAAARCCEAAPRWALCLGRLEISQPL